MLPDNEYPIFINRMLAIAEDLRSVSLSESVCLDLYGQVYHSIGHVGNLYTMTNTEIEYMIDVMNLLNSSFSYCHYQLEIEDGGWIRLGIVRFKTPYRIIVPAYKHKSTVRSKWRLFS